jgi:hypothetical protein
MTDFGQTVRAAIDALFQFHRDVSRLVRCVEERVKDRGLVSPVGGTSMAGRSLHYSFPERWMPRYVCRLYVQPASDDPREVAKQHRVGAFFCVFFTPREVNEATAMWGTVSCPDPVELFLRLTPLLFRDQGPSFPIAATTVDWTTTTVSSCEITYRTIPLMELTDAVKVETVVVDTLLDQFGHTVRSAERGSESVGELR